MDSSARTAPGSDAAAREGQAALAAFDKALAAEPDRDDYAFSDATKHLCAMRDALIAERRAGRRAGQGTPGQLERLNAVISSALAGHFPLGKTPWQELQQARGVLAGLVGSL